jgi:hypothetical protein
MIKGITSIKNNLEQKLSTSEFKDNESNENENESAKKIQKVVRGNKARQEIKHQHEAAENIQKIFRGNKVRKQSMNNKTPPAELSILNESDEKVNDAHNKTPEKADKDESPVPVHTEAPKKAKLNSPVLIGTQRKSLTSSFTEASEDKDEDLEELEQTPKKTPLQIKEEWLKKFEDADIAQKKLNRTMEYAYELETEIEKLSKDKNFKNMKADKVTMEKYN